MKSYWEKGAGAELQYLLFFLAFFVLCVLPWFVFFFLFRERAKYSINVCANFLIRIGFIYLRAIMKFGVRVFLLESVMYWNSWIAAVID